ncbi:MAG TPA: SUMF1/EgtB/PvdO family nonheme iron enzyme [Polyangiaceae bacterium]|nr:SUMF1/EgtB/PvdO family nonheme iron enzyme [Polyangiaceae bacterium]
MRVPASHRPFWRRARYGMGLALGVVLVRLALPDAGLPDDDNASIDRQRVTARSDGSPSVESKVATPQNGRPSSPSTTSRPASVASPAATPAAPSPAAGEAIAPNPEVCPGDMVLVEGLYCPDVVHTCLRWLDDEKLPFARCGEYLPKPQCRGEKLRLRYCMDRREFTAEGEALPLNHQSFMKAEALCARVGKRVCTESEWNFACEGEEMRPYPYGFQRRPVCNQDRSDLYEDNPRRQILRDNRRASGSMPECSSPFGVFDMVGNLDEPVLREAQRYNYPFRNGLKGGWWMAGRNRCRPATTAHDDHYQDIQIGIRCCRDARR